MGGLFDESLDKFITLVLSRIKETTLRRTLIIATVVSFFIYLFSGVLLPLIINITAISLFNLIVEHLYSISEE